MSTRTGRVLWHVDSCPIDIADNVIVDRILPSVIKWVQHYGFEKIDLQGHYNMTNFVCPTDSIWFLGQFNVNVVRHSKEPNEAQNAIRLKMATAQYSTPDILFLIAGDRELTVDMHNIFQERLVVATTLPESSDEVRYMLSIDAEVYSWNSNFGVGRQYSLDSSLAQNGPYFK